jgi:hypothetical protein
MHVNQTDAEPVELFLRDEIEHRFVIDQEGLRH